MVTIPPTSSKYHNNRDDNFHVIGLAFSNVSSDIHIFFGHPGLKTVAEQCNIAPSQQTNAMCFH